MTNAGRCWISSLLVRLTRFGFDNGKVVKQGFQLVRRQHVQKKFQQLDPTNPVRVSGFL